MDTIVELPFAARNRSNRERARELQTLQNSTAQVGNPDRVICCHGARPSRWDHFQNQTRIKDKARSPRFVMS